MSLTAGNAATLAKWVEAGGTLISEACPGYFGDNGHVGPHQPNNGLDAVFGAREVEVEFMPDIANRYRFELDGKEVTAGGFLQAYAPTTGSPRGKFADGRLAVVENRHGEGRALLVGTHPSVDYYRTSAPSGRAYFADVFAWTGRTPHAALDNPNVQVRVHEADGQAFLWFINATREPQSGHLTLARPGRGGTLHWGGEGAAFDGAAFTVPARDALIVQLLVAPATGKASPTLADAAE